MQKAWLYIPYEINSIKMLCCVDVKWNICIHEMVQWNGYLLKNVLHRHILKLLNFIGSTKFKGYFYTSVPKYI